MTDRILITIAAAMTAALATAQVRTGDGQISASFETNTIYYADDKGLPGSTPDDHFGSNNYLKVDYTYKKLSAGIQLEGYFPALYGYELGQQENPKRFWLGSKYISWQDENFSVLAGNVYDQFGNGLIFRSYEDRQLGLNNSLEGISAGYDFSRFVSIKGMYGRPRLYTDYAGSWVRGLDLNISIADIFNWDAVMLYLEGSYVNRYESLDKDATYDFYSLGLDTPQLDMFSGSFNFAWKGLSVKGEYARKSKDLSTASSMKAAKGAAIFAEAVYTYKSLSVSGTFRMLDDMGTMLSLYGNGTGNSLNYLPSLTRQGIASVASIVMNLAAHPYGDAAIAAFSIVNRIVMFMNSAVVGFGQGFQPVCGYNYGAGRYDRVVEAYNFCLRIGFTVLASLCIFGFIFADPLITIFRRDDAEVIRIGTMALRMQLVTFSLMAQITMANMFTQTIGYSFRSTVISLLRQGLYLIPLLVILTAAFGLTGLMLATPASDVLSGITAFLITRSIISDFRKRARGEKQLDNMESQL